MSLFRPLFLATSLLVISGCSDSPESTIDEMAERGKSLVQDARDMAEETSDRLVDQLNDAKEAAREKVAESVEKLNEHVEKLSEQ